MTQTTVTLTLESTTIKKVLEYLPRMAAMPNRNITKIDIVDNTIKITGNSIIVKDIVYIILGKEHKL